MGLYSVVRRKKPGCIYGKPHKVFENKRKQNFTADKFTKSGVQISHIYS